MEESRTSAKLCEAGVGVDRSDETAALGGDLRTAGPQRDVRCLCRQRLPPTHSHTHLGPGPGGWAGLSAGGLFRGGVLKLHNVFMS